MSSDFNFQLSEIITEEKLREYFKKGWEALSDGYKKSGKEVDIDSVQWKKQCQAEKKDPYPCEMDSFADRPKIDKGILLKILGALREHIINKIFKKHENNLKYINENGEEKSVRGRNEYFAAGSTNITSDYDLSVSGPEANEIMWEMFKTFLHNYRESLPYAFDSNLYSSPLYIHTTKGNKLGEEIPSEKLLSIREKSPATGADSFSGFPRVNYEGHGNRQFTLIPQTDAEMNEELDWAGMKLLHKIKGGKHAEYDGDKSFGGLDEILHRSIKLKEHLMKLCNDEEEKDDYKDFFKEGGEFAFLNHSDNDDDETKKKKTETKLIFKNYWMQYKSQQKCQKYVYQNKDFKEASNSVETATETLKEGKEENPVLEKVNGEVKKNIFYYSNKGNYFASEAYYTSSAVNTIVVENQLKHNLNYSSRKYMIKCKIAAAIEQIGDMTHHIEHKKINTNDEDSLKKIIVKFSKYIYRFWYILGSIGGDLFKEYEERADEINKRIIPIRAKYNVEKIKEDEWKLLDVTQEQLERNNEESKKEWLIKTRHHMLKILEDVLQYSDGNDDSLIKNNEKRKMERSLKTAAQDVKDIEIKQLSKQIDEKIKSTQHLEKDFEDKHKKLKNKVKNRKKKDKVDEMENNNKAVQRRASIGGLKGGRKKKRSRKKKRKKKRKKTKRKN